ncbi:hypothetical protein HLPR_04820 [Helicovermis profundi]|uniref:SelT/SelW/SelH family protein n=1 Tax=Helicovermis profundi TaxID=3065157 RepID=A0AAU9E1D3_9FIRM|nr:hypothetical protein HLPR_04820 [Clostridia bacterium S502]
MSLAERLLNEHKKHITSVKLVPSEGGIYDVYFNSEKIFSKFEKGDYPGLSEVESMVRNKLNHENLF